MDIFTFLFSPFFVNSRECYARVSQEFSSSLNTHQQPCIQSKGVQSYRQMVGLGAVFDLFCPSPSRTVSNVVDAIQLPFLLHQICHKFLLMLLSKAGKHQLFWGLQSIVLQINQRNQLSLGSLLLYSADTDLFTSLSLHQKQNYRMHTQLDSWVSG